MPAASTLTKAGVLGGLRRRINLEGAWYAMMILPFAYYVIFHYVPMAGIVLAFQDYKMGRGVFGSDWVGFRWFIEFFESFYFWRLMRNTLLLSFLTIVFGFPVPILFALMLNEMRVLPLKRMVQTVSYLPHFISLVIIVGMLVTFLSPNNGIVNIVIKSLGGEPINFLGLQSWFRPLYIGSGIWQQFGFGSIIYLAAIAGISQELYDAAEVDGASRIQRIRFVTIPGMASTIVILLILNVGHALSVNWEKVLLMYTPATYEVADVIDTYVYRRGIIDSKYGFASAVGLFKNVINLGFLVVFNRLARRFTGTSLW